MKKTIGFMLMFSLAATCIVAQVVDKKGPDYKLGAEHSSEHENGADEFLSAMLGTAGLLTGQALLMNIVPDDTVYPTHLAQGLSIIIGGGVPMAVALTSEIGPESIPEGIANKDAFTAGYQDTVRGEQILYTILGTATGAVVTFGLGLLIFSLGGGLI